MSEQTVSQPASAAAPRRSRLTGFNPIYIVLVVLLIAIAIKNPAFLEPTGYMNFLKRWPTLHLVGRTGSFRYMNSDGVIEDVFRLMGELYPDKQLEVRPLEKEIQRWV